MGSVSAYPTTGGRLWEVRYRKPDGRQTRKRGFNTKSAATAHLHSIENAKMRGTYVDPARGKVTVAEWATVWLDGKVNLAPSSRERYRGVIDTWIVPEFGRAPVSSVSFIDVQSWIARQGCSPASVVKNHRVLSQIFQLAVRDGRIPFNPAKDVDLPRVRHRPRRYLNPAQVESLAEAAGRWRVLILVLAFTGLRWGEAAALHRSDVDLERRRIQVSKSVTIVEGRHVWGDPKDHRHRWVPIPPSVAAELAAYMAGSVGDGLLFPGERSGKPMRVKAARESWFDRAVIDAGCPERFTPHELRHTAASLAVSAGASVKGVQRMLGHAKASMTLDVYADLFDDDLDDVGLALDRVRIGHAIES